MAFSKPHVMHHKYYPALLCSALVLSTLQPGQPPIPLILQRIHRLRLVISSPSSSPQPLPANIHNEEDSSKNDHRTSSSLSFEYEQEQFLILFSYFLKLQALF